MIIAIEREWIPRHKDYYYTAYKYNWLYKIGDRTFTRLNSDFNCDELERIIKETIHNSNCKPQFVKLIEV